MVTHMSKEKMTSVLLVDIGVFIVAVTCCIGVWMLNNMMENHSKGDIEARNQAVRELIHER